MKTKQVGAGGREDLGRGTIIFFPAFDSYSCAIDLFLKAFTNKSHILLDCGAQNPPVCYFRLHYYRLPEKMGICLPK